ncbi:MAG: VWA domain-containing protein [Planctomycetes bacterium]|nr:VWA domain-containing protein [Planctomycetota bacterium]
MRTTLRWTFLPLLLAAAAAAQSPSVWVVPGSAVLGAPGDRAVTITAARAAVRIHDRAATTTLEVELHNSAGVPREAVLLLPVPDDAAVSGFTFDGAAAEPSARVLPRDEARRLYDQITARLKDPALLEFSGSSCLSSSVFPVPAGGVQHLRLTYDHVLDGDGDRVDYVLPRSELLTADVPWQITVELEARAPIGLCYSPSHQLDTTRRGPNVMTVRVAAASQRDPGAFRLCYTTAPTAQPTATLFAYPDPTIGGGYFLLLASAPRPEAGAPMRREVTLVLDRSGSMAGPKLAQAKAAALQVLGGLADGEGIQVIDYGNDVRCAFPRPVGKTTTTAAAAQAWIEGMLPHGGTNLHDALLEALRAPVLPGTLPMVLFLTDGLPTVGPTSEKELREMVAAANTQRRRVFCFGVGNDVNSPLLDRIAESTRAAVTYVLPEEDVEVKVARAFARLDRPVLGEPKLGASDAAGLSRLNEVLPARLPDLFAGEQLVVLGRYRGDADLRFVLQGQGRDGERRFAFDLPVHSASTRHNFVPRLWASRQIAFLVDELRQRGGERSALGTRRDAFADPRCRELRDEILRLSTRFGVLGEYTAFLATEGSRLDDWNGLAMACQQALDGRAMATRSGSGAVNQGCNLWSQKQQATLNPRNVYLDQNLTAVSTANMFQVCDRAFYRRGDRWIDGNSVVRQQVEPDERVAFASERFFQLVRRLEGEGRAGVLAMRGEILLELDGKNILVGAASGADTTQPVKETTR